MHAPERAWTDLLSAMSQFKAMLSDMVDWLQRGCVALRTMLTAMSDNIALNRNQTCTTTPEAVPPIRYRQPHVLYTVWG